MMGKKIVGLTLVALLCAAMSAFAEVSISIETDVDDDTVRIDTLVRRARVLPPTPEIRTFARDNPLAHIPPEAWARMTPEQIGAIVQTAFEQSHGAAPWENRLPVEIIIPLGVFTAIVIIFYLVLRNRQNQARLLHEQRMAMIERGTLDPEIFNPPRKASRIQKMMIWGIILTLGGVGFTVMSVLEDGLQDVGPGPLFAFVGVGLIIAARYVKRDRTDEERDRAA